ncbi:protein-L-isoaspartate(D-aspartate) O-methyltransferase [uncultured Thiothrix sp.]|jgi:protein-L-isoaspartate(D-aspartate) O-methyltransferase|uniref:protein-L-isoaspartate(D-aspartate) O-methyltransferase n=1 Tax=uncultured Thiothrix sp. TaxID=223185 RepID=UPI002622A649|nr:protein-L-isoaspartate(D-aspartate) O-methyltransferase [uncultured Thiothrix sp.]HMT93850.1 protein-L-isoaspartate(D-aspartate) O-methyltransferase [Thiolinea sp.]
MALTRLEIEGIGMTSQRTRDRMIQRLREQGIKHDALLEVMRKVPRHLFMDQALATRSYEDTALPIGHGQTISQPYMVARMTELLLASEQPLEKILEVGTGSGYQAAILGKLIPKIYTVERIQTLYKQARQLLDELGYRNIRTSLSDGSWGINYEAPFDGILVTAAPEEIPQALLEQLAIGARLIIPTGKQGEGQVLKVVTRTTETDYQEQVIETVQFVPLVRA